MIAVPALEVAALRIVNVLDEVAFPQGEFPYAVKVIITLPAVISVALGVYVQLDNDVAFEKVPVPLDVHKTEA